MATGGFSWERPLPDGTEFELVAYRVNDVIRLVVERRLNREETVWIYDWWFSPQELRDLTSGLSVWLGSDVPS